MNLPNLTVQPDQDLQEAYQSCLRRLTEAGFTVQSEEEPESAEGRLRLCTVSDPQETAMHTVVVTTEPWDESLVVDVLNALLPARLASEPTVGKATFHFASAHEVPSLILHIFADDPAGQIESRLIPIVRFGPPTSQAAAGQFAENVRELISDVTGVTIDPDSEDAASQLTSVVLDHLRAGQGNEPDWYPVNALIATGCLLGEIIGHLPGYEAHWVTAPEFGAVGAGLYVIDLENQTAVTCNPIGRVFQLYQTGEEMNLASFVETVKEALKQAPEDEDTSFDSEPFSQDDEPQD